MAASKKDPTDAMRLKASRYPGVDEGTACTQSAFKTRKGAFLYIGEQGGRYKAMFKLQTSPKLRRWRKRIRTATTSGPRHGSQPFPTAFVNPYINHW